MILNYILFFFPILIVYWYLDILYRSYLFIKLLTLINCLYLYYYFTNNISYYLFDKVYLAINQNGCLVIKLTQWITTRLNILYEVEKPLWLEKLNLFFEQCPIHNISYSNSVYKELTGNNLWDDYEINDYIISSGSIGQVYKYWHKETKQYRALKIRHPNISREIMIPKTFIINLIKILKNIKYLNKYIVPIDLDGFFLNLDLQLDFNIEAQNMLKMTEIFKNENFIVIPKLYNYSSNILIMSYEDGTYFDNVKEISDFQKFKICMVYMFFYHQCAILENFNHGDLHQGNWKVRLIDNNNGKDYQIIVYDFGICYSQNHPDLFKSYIHAWEKYDINMICDMLYLAYHDYDRSFVKKLRDECYDELSKMTLKPFTMKKYLSLIYNVTTKNEMIIPFAVFNLLISLTLCENMLSKNGMMNVGIQLKDNSGVTTYQGIYQEYINFCETKHCFPQLKEHYLKVVEDSGVKSNTLFGKVDKNIDYIFKSNKSVSLEI